MSNFNYDKYTEITNEIKKISDEMCEIESGKHASFKAEDLACRLISLGNSLRMYIVHSNK